MISESGVERNSMTSILMPSDFVTMTKAIGRSLHGEGG
jgi:hypothetical protein